MEDFFTIQEISEISGLSTFHIEQIADDNYYNDLFSKYYDKHGDKKLIIIVIYLIFLINDFY